VRHRTVVAAPKSIAECLSLFRWELRVPKNLVIVDVGMTVHLEISSCRFNPFMETLPLNFIQFLRRNIPTVAGRRWSLLSGSSASHRHNRNSQEQSNCRNCNSIGVHRRSPSCEWCVRDDRPSEEWDLPAFAPGRQCHAGVYRLYKSRR
jgi:hypothetical protein